MATTTQTQDFYDVMKNYDPSRNVTRRIMTKFEKTDMIGLRAEQLVRGATPMVDFDPKHFDARQIAIRELKERKLPMMVCRKLPNGEKEYWRLDDMIIP